MSPLTRRGPPPVPPHRSTNPSSPSRPQAQQTPKNPFDPSPPLGSSPEPFFGSTSKQQDQQTHNHPAFPTSPLNAHRVVPQVATTALFNRIFVVAPYLTNPELSQLSYALPHWLRVSARFYSAPTSPEEQVELRVEGGHGTIKISLRPRDGGYGGTLLVPLSLTSFNARADAPGRLERVKAWFTALFG